MSEANFDELSLSEPLRRAVRALGYDRPTPIQARAIPRLLEGQDLLGIAQTGTGKTAAFMLPMLQRLDASNRPRTPRAPRGLVLTPTRELASQIGVSTAGYGRNLQLEHAVIFGGVGQNPQVRRLKAGLDILVATPGRLLDLMGQGHVRLDKVEIFVLDEADRMLDMGFIRDVRKIIAGLPKNASRQTLLFSATMPQTIARLAQSILVDPLRVEITPPSTTVERIEQRVLFVEKSDKRKLLASLLSDPTLSRTLVFTRTKHGANRAAQHLAKAGIRADAIHGNKSQNARQRALNDFKKGDVHVLVATDIAARGIDVPGITHVINFDLPAAPEDYVHRIGRTARAGRDGVAMSFCDVDERPYLRAIQRQTNKTLDVVEDHPFRSTVPLRTEALNKNDRARRARR